MSWPTATLDSISEVVRGVTFSKADAESDLREGLLPVLRAGNIAETLNIESDLVYVDQGRISEKQRLRPKDIVVCTSSGSASVLGKSAMLGQEWQGSFGAFLATVRTDSHVADPDFVGHYLRSPRFRAWASNSAGIGIKNIRASDLKKIEIPLPPLEEQKRIAGILDQAVELCRLRTRTLDKLNSLGQAIFHEMFGDVAQNSMGFRRGTVGDLAAETQYGTSEKARETGPLPVLRMNNLTYDGRMDLASLKYMDLKASDFAKYTVVAGDMLFNRTNSPDLVGKTAVYRGQSPMAFAGYLVRLRANAEGNTDYISAVLNSAYGKATLRGMCKSIIGMANINAKELCKISLPIPPRQLQDAFSNRLSEVDKERPKFEAAIAESNTLFASLQHRAFRGEL
ncbi:restriction endonuclease subunit S [Komagataeibacter medellinensis]|uniref:Type I DNA specificity S subunit n=1 Tax=Komagataeibacter medellinensis (strain NBRC 3288 / BCRC 11682 / LMG 1693 / Kondo 51) TaxID=634177 RepID=G2I7N3_KOMMN|nr:restriction endonuclease subunit S [Komagataeibacter medellinensis]BAK84130.1 type I DNA specificity S subunit [Komagataeibacter medellinensis NBRC 3288]